MCHINAVVTCCLVIAFKTVAKLKQTKCIMLKCCLINVYSSASRKIKTSCSVNNFIKSIKRSFGGAQQLHTHLNPGNKQNAHVENISALMDV